jgi:penicillin-binding protein 1C
LNEIGLSHYHDLLRRFGFTTLTKPPLHYGLAVTLGSGEVTLLELTNAYAALARGGRYLPYHLKPAAPLPPKAVLENAPQYAAEVTDILSDATARLKAFGFNESMTIAGRDVAVKTGTSYDYRDNWTVGYTPSYAVGVWVGHADGSPMTGGDGTLPTTGATGAAPLWHAAMELVLKDTVAEQFPKPAGRIAKFSRPEKGIELAELKEGPKGWRVSNPVPNATFRIHPYLPREHQKIAAQADVGAIHELPLRWYLDGRFIASTEGPAKVWIVPEPGKHRLKAEAQDGSRQEIAFRITTDEMN